MKPRDPRRWPNSQQNGKMVNFMFGANAPMLTRMITEELKKEQEARDGGRERVQVEISELAEEEKERWEKIESANRSVREKEEAKKAQELLQRRTAECEKILENLSNIGVILVFPHARDKYMQTIQDLLPEAAVVINATEKVNGIPKPTIDELFYFGDNCFPEDAVEDLTASNLTSLFLLLKPARNAEHTENMEQILLHIIYGKCRRHPGDSGSPARELKKENENGEIVEDSFGIWAPENPYIKATALRLFFPRMTEAFLIPEPDPTPTHFAVAFEAYRRHEIAKTMDQYRAEIMNYGFFTSEVAEDANLVASTFRNYNKNGKLLPDAKEAKLIIQLARRKSECVLAFAQLKPFYMSPNTTEGARECKWFFPEDYNSPLEDEEELYQSEPEPESVKEVIAETNEETTDIEEDGTVGGEITEEVENEGEVPEKVTEEIAVSDVTSQQAELSPELPPEE